MWPIPPVKSDSQITVCREMLKSQFLHYEIYNAQSQKCFNVLQPNQKFPKEREALQLQVTAVAQGSLARRGQSDGWSEQRHLLQFPWFGRIVLAAEICTVRRGESSPSPQRRPWCHLCFRQKCRYSRYVCAENTRQLPRRLPMANWSCLSILLAPCGCHSLRRL